MTVNHRVLFRLYLVDGAEVVVAGCDPEPEVGRGGGRHEDGLRLRPVESGAEGRIGHLLVVAGLVRRTSLQD